jgi:transcription elongation factor Elf1
MGKQILTPEIEEAKKVYLYRFEFTCEICGNDTMGTNNQKYCKDCIDDVRREYTKQYREAHYEPAGPRYFDCLVCGEETLANSSTHKYCKGCSEDILHKRIEANYSWSRPKYCLYCNEAFDPEYKGQNCCSDECWILFRGGHIESEDDPRLEELNFG